MSEGIFSEGTCSTQASRRPASSNWSQSAFIEPPTPPFPLLPGLHCDNPENRAAIIATNAPKRRERGIPQLYITPRYLGCHLLDPGWRRHRKFRYPENGGCLLRTNVY